MTRFFCLLFALICSVTCDPARAQAISCTNISAPFPAPPPAYVSFNNVVGTVLWSGTWTIRYTGCVKVFASGTNEVIALGPSYRSIVTSLVGMRYTTFTAVPDVGSCSGWVFGTAAMFGPGPEYAIPITHKSTLCNYTVTIGLEIGVMSTGAGGPYNSTTGPLTVSGSAYFFKGAGGSLLFTPSYQTQFILKGCTASLVNTTVTLPSVSNTSLSLPGSSAQPTAFSIGLRACDSEATGYPVSLTWAFAPGPQNDVIANSATAPLAGNVFVQLLDGSGTPVANGASTTVNIPSARTTATSAMFARYYSTGAATAGKVSGVATFLIQYP